MKCSHCGKKNKKSSYFCVYCGNPITVDTDHTAIRKKHRGHPLIAIISIVICLAIAAGVLFAAGVFRVSDGAQTVPGRIEFKEFSDQDVVFENNELFVKNQLLITADEQYSYDDIKRIVSEYGGEIVGCIEFTNDYQVEFKEKGYDQLITAKDSILSRIENTDVILHNIYQMDTAGADASEGGNWWRSAINLPVLESENYSYQTVNVGVFDNLFISDNSDLSYALNTNNIWYNNEAIIPVTDSGNHGTDVCGFLAAQKGNNIGIDGVANNVNLFCYAYCGKTHVFKSMMEDKYCFAKMIANGVKIINISAGMDSLLVAAQHEIPNALADLKSISNGLGEFYRKFIEAGYEYVIVKSAGNNNGYTWIECPVSEDNPYGIKKYNKEEDGKLSNYAQLDKTLYTADYDYLGAITDPKARNRIIIVGSSTNDNNRAGHSVSGRRVDIYAPGEKVNTLVSGKPGDGTSYATPMVSGVIALMWGINPNISSDNISYLLTARAPQNIEGEEYHYPGPDNSEGIEYKFLLDANIAVHFARSFRNTVPEETKGKSYIIGAVRINENDKYVYGDKKCKLSIYKSDNDDISSERGDLYKEEYTDDHGEFLVEIDPGFYWITAESVDGEYTMSHYWGFYVYESDVTYINELYLRKTSDINIEKELLKTSWDLKLVYFDERNTYVNPKNYNIGEPYWSAVKDVDTHLVFNEDGTFETSFGVKSIKGTYRVNNEDIFLKYDVYAINSTKPIETDVEGKIDIITKMFPQFSDEKQTLEFYAFDHFNYYFDDNESFDPGKNGGYEVDTNKLYSSDLIQKVGDDVYYCSSDGAPEYLALPTLDFSSVKPEYKKLPIHVEYGVQSFIIYGDSIFYICDYPNGQYTTSADHYGKLYKCDLQGNNQELIADYVNNLLFEIKDYTLSYSAGESNEITVYKYDIKSEKIVDTIKNAPIGVFELGCIFRHPKSQGHMEFDGGYYYYEVIRSSGTEPNRIDGKLANIIYYREDIETGQVDKVGYTYNQARG